MDLENSVIKTLGKNLDVFEQFAEFCNIPN